jgi:glycine betaine/proline transport system permease protein
VTAMLGVSLTEFPEAWRLPLEAWVNAAVGWLVRHGEVVFDLINGVLFWVLLRLEGVVLGAPWWLVVLVVAGVAWRVSGPKLAAGCAVGLVFIGTIGMWDLAMRTTALVMAATVLSVCLGVPIGILCARSNRIWAVVRPALDFMQTIPSFVYLVPVLMLFGIGRVPGLIATIVYAVPPAIRLTNLGIRQVPKETTEAVLAFGATPGQLLRKVELPLAWPTIMAGVNQTIMMALSMVVIASMINAGGLGDVVLRGLSQINVGRAFVGGISIVVLAIVIDRITAQAGRTRRQKATDQQGGRPRRRIGVPDTADAGLDEMERARPA